MDNISLVIDRDMAYVIMQAFSVAEHEAMTSLVYSPSVGAAGIQGRPEGRNYAAAELRVLKLIHDLYPDIARQYFDVNKQVQYE